LSVGGCTLEFWKGSSLVATFAGLGSNGSDIDDASDIARIWLGIGGLGDVDFGGWVLRELARSATSEPYFLDGVILGRSFVGVISAGGADDWRRYRDLIGEAWGLSGRLSGPLFH
jgi:hypothetical protein